MVWTACERPQKPATATTATRMTLIPKASPSLFPIFQLVNMMFSMLLMKVRCRRLMIDEQKRLHLRTENRNDGTSWLENLRHVG